MKDIPLKRFDKPYRGIPEGVLDQYGIRLVDGKQQIAFEYLDSSYAVIGRKFRDADKKIWWDGTARGVIGFGEHLANPQSFDAIAICEGEFDAATVTFGSRNKVVGVSGPNGAQNLANFCRERLERLLTFKTIYVATDMDEAGQKAAKELMTLFPAGQVRRIVWPHKDANDTLRALGNTGVWEAIRGAQELRPDGIRPANAYSGLVLKSPQRQRIPCAFQFWNDKTPFWSNQLVVLVAGSGVGKTTFARALALGAMEQGVKVGWIGLEETPEEAMFRFCGAAAGLQIHARENYSGMSEDELQRLSDADRFICGSGLLELFEHFGSLETDVVLQRMEYMVRGLGCKLLFLDHLTILGSALAQDVRQLDATVTKLRCFIAGTNCTVVAINHLARGDKSKDFEDGDVPRLHDIRGSHSIVQLADTIWALGRRRGSDTTHSYCLKNRMLGRCGYAGSFRFDEATQQMEQRWEDPSGSW